MPFAGLGSAIAGAGRFTEQPLPLGGRHHAEEVARLREVVGILSVVPARHRAFVLQRRLRQIGLRLERTTAVRLIMGSAVSIAIYADRAATYEGMDRALRGVRR